MSCISSIQELTRRSHIVTADVGVGEENQAREIVDERQQVGDCPLHPRRITDIDDDYDSDNESEADSRTR